jgi:hypothetical protein
MLEGLADEHNTSIGEAFTAFRKLHRLAGALLLMDALQYER